MSRTLAIVKPDAVEAGRVGRILAMLEDEGFRILAAKFTRLSDSEAAAFYAVHRKRDFYQSLTKFMTSGPVLVVALERDDSVAHLREVIGATDPTQAAAGTVRALYAESTERNAIHASDSDATAEEELRFFFTPAELVGE